MDCTIAHFYAAAPVFLFDNAFLCSEDDNHWPGGASSGFNEVRGGTPGVV